MVVSLTQSVVIASVHVMYATALGKQGADATAAIASFSWLIGGTGGYYGEQIEGWL
jgi:hypothetical protein